MEIKKNKNTILQLKKKKKCPCCKKRAQEPFIPFCSKKCASLDLIKWLKEEYQADTKID